MIGTKQGVDQHFFARYGSLVEIDLPIHESARSEVVLDGIDAFGVHHKAVVNDVEHLDDARRPDVAFGHACVERVTAQVIEAVNIELARNELVEEAFVVFVLENQDGQCKPAVHVLIDAVHHHERNLFMGDVVDECVLQHMRERSVTNVVHQDGSLYGFGLGIENEDSLLL